MAMSMSKHVVVVGAGIGGLAAALALLKRGIDVEVYEQSSELKEVGAGIQISSNGSQVMFALGLEDALKRVQAVPARRLIRHWFVNHRNAYCDWISCTVQCAFHVDLTQTCGPVGKMLPLGLTALNARDKHVGAAVRGHELNPSFPHVIGRKATHGSRIVRTKLVGDRR